MPRLISSHPLVVGILALSVLGVGMGCAKVTLTNPALSSLSNDSTTLSLTSVAPANGPYTGGTLVTLAGTGFVPGASVTIGGAPCTAVTVVSSASLTCVTPAASLGTVDVVVTNPDGASRSLGQYFAFRNAVRPVGGLATTSGGSHVATGSGARMTISIHPVGRPNRQTASDGSDAMMLPGVQGALYQP